MLACPASQAACSERRWQKHIPPGGRQDDARCREPERKRGHCAWPGRERDLLAGEAAVPGNLGFPAHTNAHQRNRSPEHPSCILTAAVTSQSTHPTLTGSLFKPAVWSQSGKRGDPTLPLHAAREGLQRSAGYNVEEEAAGPGYQLWVRRGQGKRSSIQGEKAKAKQSVRHLMHSSEYEPLKQNQELFHFLPQSRRHCRALPPAKLLLVI